MPSIFFCLEPCEYYGSSERGLHIHRGRNPECQRRWEEHLRPATNLDHENAVEHGGRNAEPDQMDDVQPIMDNVDENPLAEVEGDGIQPHERNPGGRAQDHEEEAMDPGDDPQEELGQPADVNAAAVIEDLCPGAAAVVATATPTFSTLYDEQMESGNGNIYYPFAGRMEWELAQWLYKSGLSRARIDEFLKLEYVSNIICRAAIAFRY
jgi:hypothetical protein